MPAAERRQALVAAAVHEFAHGGLHGTSVQRIAQRVGVAQPYVFALFGSKRELFLAALERSFERIAEAFRTSAADYNAGRARVDCDDVLEAMGGAYRELLASDRDYLMLQHQAYAACHDDVVRARARHCHAEAVTLVQRLSGAPSERVDDFIRHGMALNVAAAMDVEALSVDCPWVKAEVSGGSVSG